MNRAIFFACGLALISSGAHAQSSNQTQGQSSGSAAETAAQPSVTAQEFIKQASMSNRFEIESSRLALEQAQRDEVKTFAQRMIDDHTAAGAKMQELITSNRLTMSQDEEFIGDQADLMKSLQDTGSGSGFDRAYVEAQMTAHQQAVDLFSAYAQSGENGAVQ